MNIVVLGAGGFLGCNLVSFLKDKGHYVRAVSGSFPEYRKPAWSKADEIIEGDLKDYDFVEKSIKGMDWVLQMAANMGGVGFFNSNDYYPYIDNQRINLNVMRAMEKLGTERLFFPSSACVYPTHLNDNLDSPSLTEDMIYPANCDMSYGWEKLMTQRLCERAPFDARVGILDTIYGVYQEHEGERMKFPTAISTKVIQAKKDGKPIQVWGDGTQERLLLYVDDAMDKIYQVLTTDNYTGPVNICADEIVNVKQVAELCCGIVGIEPNIEYDTSKPSGVLSRKTSLNKWLKDYGTKNKISPREGFTKLIEWLEVL